MSNYNIVDLKNVPLQELLAEVSNRKEVMVEKAVSEINNQINLINSFGIDICHYDEEFVLLPKCKINRGNDGKITCVTYEDKNV